MYHTTVIIELDLFFPPSPVSCLHDNEILARFNMIGHYVYHDTISFFFAKGDHDTSSDTCAIPRIAVIALRTTCVTAKTKMNMCN